MELKYVRHKTIGFILWPKTEELYHSHVGRLFNRLEILSAGFASLYAGDVLCHGRSESLNIGGREDDTVALAKQLGLAL